METKESYVFKIETQEIFAKSNKEYFEKEQRPRVDIDISGKYINVTKELEVTPERYKIIGGKTTLLVFSFSNEKFMDGLYSIVTGKWYRRKTIIEDTPC